MELVINFTEGGSVTAMHSDTFDLGFLGTKRVYRQTDIVFDSESQAWNIEYFIDGSPDNRFRHSTLDGFATYETARQAEVDWLNRCRLSSIVPESQEGTRIMQRVRRRG